MDDEVAGWRMAIEYLAEQAIAATALRMETPGRFIDDLWKTAERRLEEADELPAGQRAIAKKTLHRVYEAARAGLSD